MGGRESNSGRRFEMPRSDAGPRSEVRSIADEDQMSIGQDERAPDAGCDQVDLFVLTDDRGQSGARDVGQRDLR
jgi:hypothetical protein